MTPEQLQLKQLLDANPIAWFDLTPSQQTLLRDTLRPDGPFTMQQRDLLRDRWLLVTPEQLALAQALLPEGIAIAAIADLLGYLWLRADLLTDCMMENDTYHAIAGILAILPITLKDSGDFPALELEL